MERNNLSDVIAATVRELILSGELSAGERLNEVHLAARLEVSRTPLREALGLLVAEDFVRKRPRLGYFVRSLSLEEFDQLYVMRALLDPEALRLAGLPSQSQVKELRALNQAIKDAVDDPGRVIELDDNWHLRLIDHCPNEVLLETIGKFMLRTRRYEHAFLRTGAHVEGAVTGHEGILAALEAEDLEKACKALRVNMQSAIQPMREWLLERNE